MYPRRPLAILSLSALLLAGLAFVWNAVPEASDAAGELARAGIEGEGDIPLPLHS
jgi:hypothetical protein